MLDLRVDDNGPDDIFSILYCDVRLSCEPKSESYAEVAVVRLNASVRDHFHIFLGHPSVKRTIHYSPRIQTRKISRIIVSGL